MKPSKTNAGFLCYWNKRLADLPSFHIHGSWHTIQIFFFFFLMHLSQKKKKKKWAGDAHALACSFTSQIRAWYWMWMDFQRLRVLLTLFLAWGVLSTRFRAHKPSVCKLQSSVASEREAVWRPLQHELIWQTWPAPPYDPRHMQHPPHDLVQSPAKTMHVSSWATFMYI